MLEVRTGNILILVPNVMSLVCQIENPELDQHFNNSSNENRHRTEGSKQAQNGEGKHNNSPNEELLINLEP